MATSDTEFAIINWFGQVNYSLMEWTNTYWWPIWAGLIFIGCLIGMAPLKTHHEQPFHQLIFVYVRKAILWSSGILIILPFIMLYLYDMTMQKQLADSQQAFLKWFINLAKQNWFTIFSATTSGWMLRFIFKRYALPSWSAILRKMRNTQSDDTQTDIREEVSRFAVKDFVPSKHYKKDHILVGLSEDNKPIHIPSSTWYETNMQVIGPTRYGKGVILGGLMDQAILNGDCLFYIDPKKDKFAPHVMYQACKAAGRKFYYVTLHDDGIGKWAPFAGGNSRDALARLETAFGLEFSGDPGTDYYKSQERKILEKAFGKTRNIEGIKKLMEDSDANRINAELARWSSVESLCPKNGSGFSIEKALKEDAIVYVQGSLDDSVVKSATKVFIAELIQEARRLDKDRKAHLTAVIDEVSFLASKILAQALATAVGFRVNFVLAYQSQNDLLNIDDKTVNPKYIHQSINVNSQIKAVYGGSDFETAEWAANLSGTIIKEVTKMEKTDISGTGGETWENQRTIGAQEENYINTNIVLTLPPRVCVFVQPRHLASISFSSFVPVKDMNDLDSYLEHKDKMYNPVNQSVEQTTNDIIETHDDIDSIPEELNEPTPKNNKPTSPEKPEKKREPKTQKVKSDKEKNIGDNVLPFVGKTKDEKETAINTEVIEETGFIEDQAEQEQHETKVTKNKDSSDSKSNKNESKSENKKEEPSEELSKEALKKREKNRARKAKQKAKKQEQSRPEKGQENIISQAKEERHIEEISQLEDDNSTIDKLEISDEFALDFTELNLQTDDKTMSLLEDLDDD